MNTQNRVVDTFQIVGFIVSTGVALLLIIARLDPVESTMIGLLLAIITQLFDLQLRHARAEERLLQAQALSQTLYHDPELLGQFRQMVEDYFFVTGGWCELFKARARNAVEDCHRVLRSMAGGVMEPPPGSQFVLSARALNDARLSIKQVTDFSAIRDAPTGVRTWYSQAWNDAAARGVKMTMVLIIPRKDMEIMLKEAKTISVPVGTYVAVSDELPTELDENYLIVDDRIVSFSERRADGTLGERSISIVPIDVERMLKRFDQALRYGRKSEDFLVKDSQAGPRP